MESIVELYVAMRDDERLQKNWELNQPRIDRVFEAPLIVRCPREIATAASLAIKLKFVPEAEPFLNVKPDGRFEQCLRSLRTAVATRVQNVLKHGDRFACAAITHALHYYADRGADNPLVTLKWSVEGLSRLSTADPAAIETAKLKPTCANACLCVGKLAGLFLNRNKVTDDTEFRKRLRSSEFPCLGPERVDAVGVFGFRRGWPIVDDYLWRLLERHGLLSPEESGKERYDQRRKSFERHWRMLLRSELVAPDELAATLYLWADEAEKFGYSY